MITTCDTFYSILLSCFPSNTLGMLLLCMIVSVFIACAQSANTCYSVTTNTSVTCVKVCLQNATILNPHSNLTIPSNASVNGSCPLAANSNQNYSTLVLEWDSRWFQFYFVLNLKRTGDQKVGTKHDWYLANITYSIIHSNLTYTSPGNYLSILTSDSFSYKCEYDFSVNLTETANQNQSVRFSMNNYQMQGFGLEDTTNHTFLPPDVCLGPGVTYIVPLVVGLVLLAMVVTPFIVYLFFILYVKFVKPKEIMTYSLLHSDAK